MRPRAWVLNFDAERELEAPSGASTPTAAVRARFRALEARLGGLLAEGDVVLRLDDGDDRDGAPLAARASDFVGEAWCPTPAALARMAKAGVEIPEAPPLAVLRRVNHRAFAAALGQELPGAVFVTTLDAVEATVAGASPCDEWLLKRPLGFAGRGRRKVHAGPLAPHDRAWVEASLRGGDGLQVEPWVTRTGDFALHGYVGADGQHVLGRVTRQRCDASGAWEATELAREGELAASDRDALVASGETAARALATAGYFGPFGVDAFAWREGPTGRARFNPRSEINARYSMGWAVGMASVVLQGRR